LEQLESFSTEADNTEEDDDSSGKVEEAHCGRTQIHFCGEGGGGDEGVEKRGWGEEMRRSGEEGMGRGDEREGRRGDRGRR